MEFSRRPLSIMNLGLIKYSEAMAVQKKVFEDVSRGASPDTLIVCQHYPVITYGRLAKKRHLLVSEEILRGKGIELCETDRGGDITFHGPGQAVFYPVIDLKHLKKDLHFFLRLLEESVIQSLREHFGLNAYRKEDMTGVWIGPYKVAFIGIGVKNWVTYHGLSLNISVDLEGFSLIKPCGLDTEVNSIDNFFKDGISFQKICDMIIAKLRELMDTDRNSCPDFLKKGIHGHF